MTKAEAAKIKEEIAEWLKTPEAASSALLPVWQVTAQAVHKLSEIIDAHVTVKK